MTNYSPQNKQNGEFEIHGYKMFASSTKHGDGEYTDQAGNKYGVDAGLLSVIPVELIYEKSVAMWNYP